MSEKEEIIKAIKRRKYSIFDFTGLSLRIEYVDMTTKEIKVCERYIETEQYRFRHSTLKYWLKEMGFKGHILDVEIIERKNHYRYYKVSDVEDIGFEEVI